MSPESNAEPASAARASQGRPAEAWAVEPWSAAHRVAFRFWFAFVVAVLFPYPIGALPGTSWLGDAVQKGWDLAVAFSAAHVLHLPLPVDPAPNGSGDRTYDWIALGLQLVLAVVATGVWTAVDRRRAYPRLREGLRIAIRFEVGSTMVSYGLAKIFVGQFPPLGAARLLQTYGDSSPMGLLWNFMGYSRGYCAFTGAVEVLGAVLLFHRRTTTLGALVLAGVLANVVALNFFYDVPVKIYSSFLLVQVLWLLARNARALFAALVGGVAARVTEVSLALGTRLRRRARLVAKIAFLGFCTYGWVREFATSASSAPDAGPFGGFYEVASFASPGSSGQLPDDKRWRRVYVGTYGQFYVQAADGHLERMGMKAEAGQPEIELRRRGDDATSKLRSSTPDPTHWSLAGTVFGDPIEVTLVRAEAPRSFLVERGFHWVNDYPLNR